jgi:cell division protein FtsQ
LATSIPLRAEPVRVASAPALLFVVGASLFVILATVFAVSRSSLFGLRHVEVDARGHRTASEVRALAGLGPSANVVWLDTAAIERRLEADPWIASATVTRSLPWTVHVSVRERKPIGVLGSSGTAGVLVAVDGTTLGPAPAGTRLPTISLPPSAPATVGLPGEGGAVRAIAAMSPGLRHRVREVDVAVGGTLTIHLRDGSAVALGRPVDVDEKVRVLRRLLAWERMNEAELGWISLVAPSAPAAVPRP